MAAMRCQVFDNCIPIWYNVPMKSINVRQIADNTGVSPQAVRKWDVCDFTPAAVAAAVLEKADIKEAQATVLIAQVQKMRTYAKELTE